MKVYGSKIFHNYKLVSMNDIKLKKQLVWLEVDNYEISKGANAPKTHLHLL